MFQLFEKAIMSMALLRIISGSIEIFVAILILKFNDIEKALLVNSSLAMVGPIILIITTTIGLVGLSERVSLTKLIWIFGGVACILYGVRSS
ncbi:YqhV family protein [Cytobacillus praedii]|uniref:YqhV family protein n=1 Tax=Cytobacillus praedii TaxID=1742358 RepID=UPI00070B8541|nr:YqhV family protein [Cytobacillus praedii]